MTIDFIRERFRIAVAALIPPLKRDVYTLHLLKIALKGTQIVSSCLAFVGVADDARSIFVIAIARNLCGLAWGRSSF